MNKIVITQELKQKLDIALSTTINSKQHEEVLVSFIRTHINSAFALSDCKCKSKLMKAKKVVKQRYNDIVVLDDICEKFLLLKQSMYRYSTVHILKNDILESRSSS